MPPSPWSSVDYALDWPGDLLCAELRALLDSPHRGWSHAEVDRLLTLAFHGPTPARHFRDYAGPDGRGDLERAREWIDRLLDSAALLRAHTIRAPYWRARRAGVEPPPPPGARRRFARLVEQLHWAGYFGRDTHEPCPYDTDDGPAFFFDLATTLEHLLQQPGVWKAEPETWDDDTFFELIEVVHDLAGRPREFWQHHAEGCRGHHYDFDTDSGRRIYRALVNRILADDGLDLRLAADGEDEGRLVRVIDEARTDLVERALQTPSPSVRERVRHAVAQFRGRTATAHDKRSAVLTLAGILEERRELIRENIGRKDEGALFQIANEFAIRHQRRGQQGDYDPVFLDWIFWWYLGTIELTDRLLARQAGHGEATA